ncbi:hypothetical protein [Ramlibacter tataouinensis]|uniref:Lipocalin-like domain-containing protein n=1 Tax=Ramlibacter tataouinensis TaxID=94132 RepID=A0A127JQ06_9BURK|nr:hypothetical protein [Ramlibacter tataouinensis]AMO22060.1 hypothetical protein UC35_03175 [Ramlibacter tataouinensis]
MALAAAALVALATGCSGSEPRAEQFVGKWKSSRLATAPLHMHGNGEWEIRSADSQVMQYGLWQLEGQRMVWNIKIDGRLERDVNAIVSAGKNRFELRERDGSVTRFERLE